MRRFFKIYCPFASNQVKRNLAYKGSFYLFMLCYIFSAFIAYFLWMAIYKSSGTNVLGGLTQQEMVLYIFMTYVTSNTFSIGISDELATHIEQGSIAMNLIKPMDYRLSLISGAFGNLIYRFFAPSIFVWVALEVYRVQVLHMPMVDIQNIVLYLISGCMSFLIYVLFDFCFGMISFITTFVFGLELAKTALLSFLSGQLIPLSFFPDAWQQVFNFLPFSSMVYSPVMLYLGKYSGYDIAFTLAKQALWVIILYSLGSFIWQKVTKRLVVLGG